MTTMHGQLFTAGEAARACGVSRTTISRAAAAGRIPGAERDEAGAWTLPLSGLLAAGYNPGKPSPPEDAPPRRGDDEAPVPAEVFRLRIELEQARAEARIQADRAASLERERDSVARERDVYMRMLEAPRETAPIAPQPPEQPQPMPTPRPVSAEQPRANVGKLRRIWNVARFG